MLALPNDKAQRNDWEIVVPKALSLILEFKPKLSEPVLGLKEWQPQDRPHLVGLIYYSFRIMIAIGFFLAAVMAVSVLQWLRGKLSASNITQQRWLLWAWIFSAPLGFIAIDSGWIVRCVGRQPWSVYGQLRTVDSVSHVPASNVLTSLLSFATIYIVLFFATLYYGSRIIQKGPNLNLPIPGRIQDEPAIKTAPAELIPDGRPLEAES